MNALQKITSNTITKEESRLEYNPKDYAAVYARTSSKNDKFSIDSQIEKCMKKLYDEKLLLHNIYKDKESATSKHFSERSNFGRLIEDLKSGMFKTLILLRRDRLTRDLKQHLELRGIFKKHNIRVIYVTEGELNTSSDTYISMFLDNIMMAIADLEADRIASRTRSGIEKSRLDGRYSHRKSIPYAFTCEENAESDKESKVKHYYPNHESNEYKAVNHIFNYFSKIDIDKLSSDKYNKLVKQLSVIDQNKKFNNIIIKNIIENPIYAGYMLIDTSNTIYDILQASESIDDALEKKLLVKTKNVKPIVNDIDIWQSAIINFYSNKRKYTPKSKLKEPYLFYEMIKCNTCGKYLELKNDYYTCGKKCHHIKEDHMIIGIISQIILDSDDKYIKKYLKNTINSHRKDIRHIQSDLKLLEQDISNLLQQYMKNRSINIAEEIKNYKSTAQDYKNDINICYKRIDLLNFYLEDIASLKLIINNFILKNIDFLKENTSKINKLLDAIVEVLQLDTGGEVNLYRK